MSPALVSPTQTPLFSPLTVRFYQDYLHNSKRRKEKTSGNNLCERPVTEHCQDSNREKQRTWEMGISLFGRINEAKIPDQPGFVNTAIAVFFGQAFYYPINHSGF